MGRNAGWTDVLLATAILLGTACTTDSIAQGTRISDGVVKIGLMPAEQSLRPLAQSTCPLVKNQR
jgi:hypothetical protein